MSLRGTLSSASYRGFQATESAGNWGLLWSNNSKTWIANTRGPFAMSGDGNYIFARYGTSSNTQDIWYRSTPSNYTFQQQITASGTLIQNASTVAFDETGTRVAIGYNGFLDIMVRSGTTWTLEQTITPTVAGTSFLAPSLSFNGDYLVIGNPGATVSTITNAGEVYVYTRTGTTWSLQDTINLVVPTTSDQFGAAVDIDDANSLIVIGAPQSGGSFSGEVYVYSRSGSVWSQDQVLGAPAINTENWGRHVAMAGDGTAFSVTSTKTGSVSSRGRLGIYYKPASLWALTYQFTNPYPGGLVNSLSFGEGTAISNDGLKYYTAGVNQEAANDDANLYAYANGILERELLMDPNVSTQQAMLFGSSSNGKLLYGFVQGTLYVFISS
jgi:hypothetical protein